jgi:hypothetical protein
MGGVSSSEYRKLLRHPKWQKMKTRVQIRADYKCEHPDCDYILDENNHLNVHHTYYEKGKKPWEYPIDSLQCLCERHHKEAHGKVPEAHPPHFWEDEDNSFYAQFHENGEMKKLWSSSRTEKYITEDSWYENGQKAAEGLLADDFGPLSIIAWKPNGEVCPDTNVKDGNGVWVEYSPDGTEFWRKTYKDGKLVQD